MPKLRNIILFFSIGAVLVLLYIFFIKKSSVPEANLLVSTPADVPAALPDTAGSARGDAGGDFLGL